MVWTIPLSEVAGVLAVSFTPGVPVMLAPDTPVQRPGQSAPRTTEPKTEPTTSAPPTEEPAPPELPPDEVVDPSDPTAGPAPAPAPTPFDPPPAPQATDDEKAPSASDNEDAKKRGPDRVLQPTDRRRFFHMSAGGASSNGVYQYYGAGPMDFQIEGMIGSHTKMFPNFGGAFVMQYRKGFTTELSFAGRLVWDKPLSKAFAIYSSTDFTFGLNVPIGRAGYFYPGIPSALFGIGWGVKMILLERLLLSIRPIAPNLVGPAYGNQLYIRFRWDVSGGIGVVW